LPSEDVVKVDPKEAEHATSQSLPGRSFVLGGFLAEGLALHGGWSGRGVRVSAVNLTLASGAVVCSSVFNRGGMTCKVNVLISA
jgi:hypothetical protein